MEMKKEIDQKSDNFSDANNTIIIEDQSSVEWQSWLYSLCELYFYVNIAKENIIKDHPDLCKKIRTIINTVFDVVLSP